MSDPIGLYDVVEILGRGHYATVCVARVRESLADRRVALKVLHERHMADMTTLHRFRDEAWVLSKLNHRNIVTVHALHDYDGRPVMEMELIEGVALHDVLQRFPDGIPVGVALEIVLAVAGALQYAFQAPVGPAREPMYIVHRDVKPANISIAANGEVKVLDFGIAKGEFEGRAAKSLYMVAGSQGFVPPERVVGEASPSIDVYALGTTLFTALTGKVLVTNTDPDRHEEHVQRQLTHLRAPGLSEPLTGRLRELIYGMTRFLPDDRPNYDEILRAVRAILSDAGLDVDMAEWAREVAMPVRQDMRDSGDIELQDKSDVLFLEAELPSPLEHSMARLSAEQGKALVRKFLSDPAWETRQPALQKLLNRCEEFPAGPFLAVLDRAERPKWQFWARPSNAAQIEAALMLLCDHPSPEVAQRARALAESSDARIATAARFVLMTSGG